MIINDMRQIKYSDLAVTDVRKKIEKNLIQTLKENNYEVVNRQEAQPKLSDEQSRFADGVFVELEFLITEYRLIKERKKEKVRQEELSVEKTKQLLSNTGHKVETLSAYDGIVDGKKVFVRPGSAKPKGWQITLRDEFRNSVKRETGYLLVNRGNGLLIPFELLRDFLGKKLEQSTVDIFVHFESNSRAKVFYKKKELDVSQFFIQ